MRGLEQLHGQLSVVAVAHRVSTLRNCDVIYVMDKGRVVDAGSYHELQQRAAVVDVAP